MKHLKQPTSNTTAYEKPLQLVDPECTLKPKINKKSHMINRKVSDLFSWHRNVQLRREEAIRKKSVELKRIEDE